MDLAARKIYCESYPEKLTIETSAICNLSCVMCSRNIEKIKRPPLLDEKSINSIRPFFDHATSVDLHGIGEPLLSPAFWYFLDNIPDHGKSVSVNSNFSLRNDALIEKLADSNLEQISVSLDAATASTYRKIRGGVFSTVVRNIRVFLARRTSQSKTKPRLLINMTMMLENINELTRFMMLALRLGVDGVFIGHLNRWPPEVMSMFLVRRGDFVFDYSKQGLWNYTDYSNQHIKQALDFAKAHNLHVYIDHNK